MRNTKLFERNQSTPAPSMGSGACSEVSVSTLSWSIPRPMPEVTLMPNRPRESVRSTFSRLIAEKRYSMRMMRVSHLVATSASTGNSSPSHSISPERRATAERFISQ